MLRSRRLPEPDEEFANRRADDRQLDRISQVLTTGELVRLQETVDAVYVDPALVEYAVRLVTATRSPEAHGRPRCSAP